MQNIFHLINAARLLIIVDALLSWFMARDAFPRSVTAAIMDPIYAPLRELLGGLTGSADLSPLVALIILQVVHSFLLKEGYREPR